MMSFRAPGGFGRAPSSRLILAAAAAFALNGGPEKPIVQALSNPIVIENQQPGDINWDVSGSGDPSIQGFATDISINTGETVNFKIKTDSNNYAIDIYRLGYYGGTGARKVATLGSFTDPQNQSVPCATDATTGLFDCGTWAVSASWPTAGAVSGIYIAKLTRADTGGSSHMIFIVRDDARSADVMFQTSDTTWQAYNQYGSGSLYCGGPISNSGTAYGCAKRSAKVSYNRPFDTRAHDPQNWVFSAEYPMVRWLEANGYDVKYQTGVDTDRRGAALVGLARPKAFLSVGHDEYWSGNQRTMVENARDAGVHVAFFSGNEMFWKTRFEPSIDGTTTPYRTLVTYKETLAGAKIDPATDTAGHPIWTGSWRDPRFSPPADGGRPENGLTGTAWTVNSGTTAITVPASMAGLRLWQNTRVAQLTSGAATLASGTLGYEWDEDVDNGARPAGLVHLSSTTLENAEKLLDYGATVGFGSATHALTLYRHASGALVFGAGTVQWSWGLDGVHDRGSSIPDQAIQQATVNLLADMGVQPGSLQVGADRNRPLLATSASTDQFAPASNVTSPPSGGQFQGGNRLTISGTATDSGGAVAGVEVSTDGGATWHLARGGAAWSYDWLPPCTNASVTIRSRAIDDSGNIEAAGTGITVSTVAGSCPRSSNSLWDSSAVPAVLNSSDANPVEIGLKFTSDVDGFISAVRFYKGPANTGTHQGSLWTIDGRRLATAVFAAETAAGWQQVSFDTPVPIAANTTYVASYHSNVGAYSVDAGYFTNLGVDSPPLHAAPSGTSGGNGLFSYGASVFPTRNFKASNYWVDVVFAETVADEPPPDISSINVVVIDGSTATVTWKTNSDATSRIDYSIDPSLAPGATDTQSDGAFVMRHKMRLDGLTPNATYHVEITSVDRAGTVRMAMAPQFTLPGPTLHDTASADFLAGTRGVTCDTSGACAASTYVAQTGDGELILAPIVGSEFTGPTLPTGWINLPWSSEGYSIIDDGVLVVDGARVASCVTDATGACVSGETASTTPSAVFTSPRTLEFSAKFSGEHFQHAGFGATFASPSEPWAMFSTLAGGQLYARTNTEGGSVDTPLGPALLGRFHRFRIDWKPASIDYYVDGVLVDHQPLAIDARMRPIAGSDFDSSGGVVFIEWMRMTPYAGSGSFLSRVFDAKAVVNWASISWTSGTPAGTSLAIYVRTGNTPTPDATWSSFALVSEPGGFSAQSQYVQYLVDMATVDVTETPELDDIIISTNHAPVAVDDSAATSIDTTYTFRSSGPGSLTFNDTDADGDRLRVSAVTSPAHGVVTVNAAGSVRYTPAPGFRGDDRFTYSVSDGLLSATGTVVISVGVSPTANTTR